MTLLSTLLGACIGNFLNFSLHQWKTGGSFFLPYALFAPAQTTPKNDSISSLRRPRLKAGPGSRKTKLRKNFLVPALTAILFGLSYLCFQNQWLLVAESFFFISFMILLAACDLQWRLLPHLFTNSFILVGLLFRNGFVSPWHEWFVAVSDCLLTGSILFAAGQIIRQGLGGGDIKMASGLAVWLGLPKCFLALLAAFTAGSFFVLPLLIKGKVTAKTPIPLGPFLAAGALLIWFCPRWIDSMGIRL